MSSSNLSARRVVPSLALVAVLGATALAQLPPPSTPVPPPSPVIARVEGREITQKDFDAIAEPYFTRLRAEMKDRFDDEVKRVANRNVMDELVRRELLVVEAQRQKIPVGEMETDRYLRQDPFFQTQGKFDPQKFSQYKISPTSNYLKVLPRVREMAGAAKLDSMVRARCTPAPAAVRAEWAKRSEQVRFQFLPLGLRDVSLEGEATQAEIGAYYTAHADQFERRPRARFRYLRLSLPPAGDSLRASAESGVTASARGVADSLRAGVPLDTLATARGGAIDSGLLDIPSAAIPGLGWSPELSAAIAHADSDTTVKVIGPIVVGDAVVVGTIAERVPRTLPPLREVVGEVKRRADLEARGKLLDAERLAYYDAHATEYRTRHARVTRVVAREATPAAERSLAAVAAGWRAGRDVRTLARGASAVVETLGFVRGDRADSLFRTAFVDSLLDGTAGVTPGAFQGPSRLSEHTVVWRMDALDTAFVPPYETVRARVDQAVAERKRRQDEEEGRTWFEAHRTAYRTRSKIVIEYISVKIPPPDSIQVPETELRGYYDSHRDQYKVEEQVRARHILIGTRSGQGADAAARGRTDSLLAATRAGADFADLARRFSQDPGSAVNGGDLGFFARGRMVKEFSDTSFALAAGQVSQPVKTQFGYHLIKVEEKKPAGVRTFEEEKEEIRRQLAQARGDSTARRTADSMRRQIARGLAATVVAMSAGGVVTSPPFATTDPVPGLGLVPGLSQDLDRLPVARWAPAVYRASASYVLARLARRIAQASAEFEEAKSQAIEDAKNAKKREILARKIAAIRADLAAGATLDSVAAVYGGLKDSGLLGLAAGFVPRLGVEPRVLTKAFALGPGSVTDTVATAQGVVWMRLEEKKTLQGASFVRDREAIRLELMMKKYGEWVEGKKKTLKVEILRADLRSAPPTIPQGATLGGQN